MGLHKKRKKYKTDKGAAVIAVPAGGAGGNCPPKFPRFGQNSNFSGSDMKNLGKVRSFRALTLITCKN